MTGAANRLFPLVMFWTITTTVFTWLPLVRILGRPQEYHWAVLGFSGTGTDGPFWIFIPFLLFAVGLLYSAHRAPRAVFYLMLLLWHAGVTALVLAGVLAEGAGATIQGQGLRWEFPLWLIVLPCAFFTGLAAAWIVADRRAGGAPVRGWSRRNTNALATSLALLLLAIVLFRAGTNYNWVTAAAIIVTVTHWILLARSFDTEI